jgi:signal peptidase I
MDKFDEPEGFFDAPRRETRPPSEYDPLHSPWDDDLRHGDITAGDDDYLFAVRPAPVDDDHYVFNRYQPETAVTYPDRYHPFYEERLTELQRRLREETVTLPKHERRWAVTIREVAETLLLAALIFLAVRASFQNFRVEGASMQPSLQDGEYLIVNKLSYAEVDLGALDWLPFFDSGDNPMRHLWGEPERGDVIVFRSPTSINRDFIKRVIGVPGDTVNIYPGAATGEVLVNGQRLDETYTQGQTNCGSDPDCTWEVPEKGTQAARDLCGSEECFFVMGDNRQNSSDSRQGWFVPKENIIGKALITYWHEGSPNIGLAPNESVGMAEEAEDDE